MVSTRQRQIVIYLSIVSIIINSLLYNLSHYYITFGISWYYNVYLVEIKFLSHYSLVLIYLYNIFSYCCILRRFSFSILRYAPFGIMFLIAGKVISVPDLGKTASQLGLYMLTVILGLLIHACGTLSLMFFIITRRNPLQFFRGLFQAWITALATASRWALDIFNLYLHYTFDQL